MQEQRKVRGYSLYDRDKEIIRQVSEERGLNDSAALRQIIREWSAQNQYKQVVQMPVIVTSLTDSDQQA